MPEPPGLPEYHTTSGAVSGATSASTYQKMYRVLSASSTVM